MKTMTYVCLILLSIAFFSFWACSDSVSPEDHFEAVGCFVIQDGDTLIYYIDGIVTGEITVNSGSTSQLLQLQFISDDGDTGVPQEAEQSISWEIADISLAEANLDVENKWGVRITGLNKGSTTIIFSIMHGDHPDFVSKPFPLIIN